ncbi:helix-turn-helix domain-containing protein [Nocardia asteroides]|uniref:helix-turn-helix domain-containing protein n=1 Tax=Nocardia asteroides TaxID=1824 RepID=UPI00378BC0FD
MRPIVSDHELDSGWELARAGSPEWAGMSLSGFRDRSAAGLDMRIVAMPAVTVVVQVGESLFHTDASPRPGHRTHTGEPARVEVRLAPTLAYALLGVTPGDLAGTVAGIEDIWGPPAARLRERLAETPAWPGRFAVTTRFLADHSTVRRPDPEVAVCWQRIVEDHGLLRIRDLTDLTGWSQKRLWTRFTAQIGVTPKRAAMVVRFRRAFDQLAGGASIAATAVDCGYTDQSHLHRDMVRFARTTPGALSPP